MRDLIPISRKDSLLEDRLPTATELARVRHTIENLRTSGSLLTERLNAANNPAHCETVHRENHRHALELAVGWEELGRMIGELPESFIDKTYFTKEVENGLRRSNPLIDTTWNQFTTQR